MILKGQYMDRQTRRSFMFTIEGRELWGARTRAVDGKNLVHQQVTIALEEGIATARGLSKYLDYRVNENRLVPKYPRLNHQ